MISDKLTRLQATGWIVLFWAAIYLPALGALEIKGEEGRRILPAVTMLETGRWIVPQIGGVDYLSKPPLINWAVAAAFRLDPTHSELAARLPCALAALALGLTAVWSLAAWLTPGGALVAAIFTLTNIGLMEKGRLAEIEGLYVPLFGIALFLWLGAWRTGANAWRTWTLPWVFLGVGMLAKGPLHVAYFYGAVGAILASAGRLREMVNARHVAGVAILLGIFAPWAVPYLQLTAADRVGEVWRAQFEGRLEVNGGFHFSGWILNVPRGLANYLPWAVLLPLLWRPGVDHGWPREDQAILRGGRWALAAGFLAVSLVPGGMPRYTLPLLALASALLALTTAREWSTGGLPRWIPQAWARTLLVALALTTGGALAAMLAAEGWGWFLVVGAGLALGLGWNYQGFLGAGKAPGGPEPLARLYPAPLLAIASAVVMASLTWEYAVAIVPRMRRLEDVRPLAAQIDATIPPGEGPVFALAPGFLPFLFYLRQTPRYLADASETPPAARYLLVRGREEAAAVQTLAGRDRPAQAALRLRDKNRGNWTLLRVEPAAKEGL